MNRMFPNQWPSTTDQQASADQEFIGLSDIAEFLRRYIGTIIACLAAALLVAGFYNLTTDPTLPPAQIRSSRTYQHLQEAGEINLSLDTARVESQIAVMQSGKSLRWSSTS